MVRLLVQLMPSSPPAASDVSTWTAVPPTCHCHAQYTCANDNVNNYNNNNNNNASISIAQNKLSSIALTAVQTNTAVASLGWVTPGAATEGVTPLFFSWKNMATFFTRQFCGVTPDFFFAKTDDLFLLNCFMAFYCFHSGVTPLKGVTLHLFTCPT